MAMEINFGICMDFQWNMNMNIASGNIRNSFKRYIAN